MKQNEINGKYHVDNSGVIWEEEPQIQKIDFLYIHGFFLIWISTFFWGNSLFLNPFYTFSMIVGFLGIGYLDYISIISIIERFNVYYYLTSELFSVVQFKRKHYRHKKTQSGRRIVRQSETRIILDNIKRITIKKKIYGIQFRFEYFPEEDNEEDEGDFETVGIKKYRELISSILRSTDLELVIEKRKVILV